MTDIYSGIADIYHKLFPVNPSFIGYVRGLAAPGACLLDAGCGSGAMAGRLAEQGFSVTGVDADPAMIARAKRTCPGVEFHTMDVLNLDRISGSFHCIYCIGNVISYLNTDDKARLIRIVRSMLVPGGYWITQMVNWDAIVTRDRVDFQEKTIPDKDIVFKRSYPEIRSDRVVFQTELIREGIKLQDTAVLYPVTAPCFHQMHSDVGFRCHLHAGNFDETPYDPSTVTGNVFVFINPKQ